MDPGCLQGARGREGVLGLPGREAQATLCGLCGMNQPCLPGSAAGSVWVCVCVWVCLCLRVFVL